MIATERRRRRLKTYLGLATAAALAAPATGVGVAAAQEIITFPGRAADLPDGAYWAVREFSEGCCIIDFNVRKWEGSKWDGSSGSGNAGEYDWGVPLYAPASGVIASCWRSFPDNSGSTRHADFPSKIFTGGNHVTILTDDGNAIAMAHFQQNTIPKSLCPSNNNDNPVPSTMAKEGDWRVASYIATNRPRVEEGQYLGLVGNSGESGGPHLHMDIRNVAGTDSKGREDLSGAQPIRFRHMWGYNYDELAKDTPGGWYRLRGNEFTGGTDEKCKSGTWTPGRGDCRFKMIHASPYFRRADADAGAVKRSATLFVSSNRAVTATVGADNNLKLIGWDLVGVSSINRKGDISAGATKEVVLSEPTSGYVLAAVRQADDILKMVAFKVTPTGGFQRVADATAGKISRLEMATFGGVDKKAATAVRTEAGDLKVIVWDIAVASNGTASIQRLGEASAGAVSAVSISRAKNFNGVYTAVRDSDGNLKVVPWKISANGQTVTRGKDAEAGKVGTTLAVAPLGQGVAVAARDNDGKLRVITWSANSNGDIGARRGTNVAAGGASEIVLFPSPHGGSNLTAVMRDDGGDLRLVGYAVNDTGTDLRRVGVSKAGAASQVSADVVSRSYPGNDPRDMILTSVRDSAGNLKLIEWDTNLVNP